MNTPCTSRYVLGIRERSTIFFQAEDGIRDYKVTGVQTCALPICKENDYSLEHGFRLLSAYRTHAGETTLLNILGKFIPSDERILLIEDTSEIQMDQDNLVRFEARQPQNGLPAVSIRDLLKAALRHRPDRIILGEIRGGVGFGLFQLLNTGHSGSLSTVHATSARQALARFTSCVLQSGVDLPYRAIKTNTADSLGVVVDRKSVV